jgi:hypothetical protein
MRGRFRKRRRRRPESARVIDYPAMIDLLGRGFTRRQIALKFGVTRAAVTAAMKRLTPPEAAQAARAPLEVIDPVGMLLEGLRDLRAMRAALKNPEIVAKEGLEFREIFSMDLAALAAMPRLIGTLVDSSQRLVELASVESWIAAFFGVLRRDRPTVRTAREVGRSGVGQGPLAERPPAHEV